MTALKTMQLVESSSSTSNESASSLVEVANPAQAEKRKRGRPVGSTSTDKQTRKILELAGKGLSQMDIGKVIGRDVAQVNRTLMRFRKLINLDELKEFREFKLDIIDQAKLKSLKSMLDDQKHAQANLRDAAQAFKVLNEASRLERCLPTKAQAIAFTHLKNPPKG
jgi:hypothetical protein